MSNELSQFSLRHRAIMARGIAMMTVDTGNSYFRLFDEISFGRQLSAAGVTLHSYTSEKLGEYHPAERKIYLNLAAETAEQIIMHECCHASLALRGRSAPKHDRKFDNELGLAVWALVRNRPRRIIVRDSKGGKKDEPSRSREVRMRQGTRTHAERGR